MKLAAANYKYHTNSNWSFDKSPYLAYIRGTYPLQFLVVTVLTFLAFAVKSRTYVLHTENGNPKSWSSLPR